MLRKRVRAFVLDRGNHPLIKKLARVLVVIGLLWIFAFPFISRNVFTSENALKGEFLDTQFNLDGGAYATYRTMRDQIKAYSTDKHKDFIITWLGTMAEVNIQELPSKKDKHNIYTYVRSPRGYGNECNLLALPINYKASVVAGMAFVDTWVKRQPKWQSKDLLVVFYEELDYAIGIREFLESYHQQTGSGSRIEGRCGYIRQGYTFVFTDYEYNKFSLFVDGVNAQFSDIDFYDSTREGLARQEWKFDFSLPYYFQLNPYLERVSKALTAYVRELFIVGLDSVMTAFFEKEANSKGTVLQMLENIKNQYVGRPHLPHSYMIEFGIHAITLRGTHDAKAKTSMLERERILKTMGLMEQLFRVDDQLDEQLHAGYYFYLLTSKSTFVSNSGFVYPIVLILVGFFITNFIFYNERYLEAED